MSKVLLIESSYDDCDAAIAKVFETFPIDISGKNVCIKVNALKAGDPDELPYVTHYRILAAVIKKVESYGPASIVVGDGVGTESYGKSDEVFEKTKLKQTAGKYYKNFNKNLVVKEIKEPYPRKIACLADVLNSDVYISLPKMKTHGLTMMSGAMKNNYGVFTGAQKSWFHYVSIEPKKFVTGLAEAFNMRRPDLVIVDGIVAMEGYGPASKEKHDVGKIIAGVDSPAIDTVLADIMGFAAEEVPLLKLARERNMGETDLSKIEVIGDKSLKRPYKLPTPPNASYSYRAGVGNGSASIEYYRERVAYRPAVDKELCVSCSECRDEPLCVKNCPTNSLTKADPISCNKDTCLVCSSCMEWCPVRAISMVPDAALLEQLAQKEKDLNYPVFE